MPFASYHWVPVPYTAAPGGVPEDEGGALCTVGPRTGTLGTPADCVGLASLNIRKV
jgi:hypothetical protein